LEVPHLFLAKNYFSD